MILPALLMAASATPVERGAIDSELKSLQQEVSGRKYRAAIDRLDHILALPLSTEQRQRMAILQGVLLAVDGERARGLTAIAAVQSLNPQAIEPARIALEFGRGLRDVEISYMAMESLLGRGAAGAQEIDFGDAMWVVRKLKESDRKSEADALVIRMERAGVAAAEIGRRGRLKLMAAQALIESGRLGEAAEAMHGVHRPDQLREALVDRVYAPIWPALEAYAGPHMHAAATAAVEEARRAWAEAEQPSPDAIRALVEAYFQAGRFDEADALASSFAATADGTAVIDEKSAWLIDMHADVLRAMGRIDDADKRYTALPAIEGKRGAWLVSMSINRLHSLVGDGRWAEAAKLQDTVSEMAERHGTPYARQLVRRMRLCIAHGLDPQRDLAGMIDELKAHDKDAPGVATEGLMCVGRMDEAEAAVIRALAVADRARSTIDSLQPFESRHDEVRTIWTAGWAELCRRPTVQVALNKVGRVLPRALWPAETAGMR